MEKENKKLRTMTQHQILRHLFARFPKRHLRRAVSRGLHVAARYSELIGVLSACVLFGASGDTARKEFTQTVRELVMFIRKRDKRVKAHKQMKQRERDQRMQEAASREIERKRAVAKQVRGLVF